MADNIGGGEGQGGCCEGESLHQREEPSKMRGRAEGRREETEEELRGRKGMEEF